MMWNERKDWGNGGRKIKRKFRTVHKVFPIKKLICSQPPLAVE
jgi:hypothetical protein